MRKQACGEYKLAKILVVGATGNVGSGVVASLAAKGEQVVALAHSGGAALQTEGVEVIAGDHRGARGKVLRLLPDRGRVVVEGVNMVYRHVRRSRRHPQGGPKVIGPLQCIASN